MSDAPPTTWADVPKAVRAALAAPLVKRADGLPVLSPMVDVMGWRAGDLNANWGGPRPVTNLLIGAALGSLGGYGAGRLAEAVIPERYLRPGALRRRGALLGGLLGAAPAVWQASDNIRQTGDWKSIFNRWPVPEGDTLDAHVAPMPREKVVPPIPEAVDLARLAGRDTFKEAADLFAPQIGRDDIDRIAWGDPHLPPPLRAATAGLYEAASSTRGSELVSPFDIGRIAVGAGAGLISGVIAGKALGLLAGLSPEAQQGVQRIGLAAGILNSVIPGALGLNR